MDEILYSKRQRKPQVRRPKDPHTLDLFTGEPHGKAPAPHRLSSRAFVLLEHLSRLPDSGVTLSQLASSPPGKLTGSSVRAALSELGSRKFLTHALPRPLASRDEIVLGVSEAGRDHLRRARDAEKRAKQPSAPSAPPVLDRQESKARAEVGMQRSGAAQTEEWRRAMMGRLRLLLRMQPTVTVDDFWEALGRGPYTPSEGSALGSVMTAAAARGWCRKTKDFRRSERAPNHGAIRPVWKSMIYEPREVR